MRSITASSLRDFDRWQISSPWPAFAGIFNGSPRNTTKLLPAWRRARPINRHPWYGGNVYGLCGMAFGARRRLAPWPVRGAHSMPAVGPGGSGNRRVGWLEPADHPRKFYEISARPTRERPAARVGSNNSQRGHRDRKELGRFNRDCRNISVGEFAISGAG